MLKRIALASAVVGALAMTTTPITAAAEEPVLLKVPIAFSTELPGLGETIKWLADRMEHSAAAA